jgi:hypothetical protein
MPWLTMLGSLVRFEETIGSIMRANDSATPFSMMETNDECWSILACLLALIGQTTQNGPSLPWQKTSYVFQTSAFRLPSSYKNKTPQRVGGLIMKLAD